MLILIIVGIVLISLPGSSNDNGNADVEQTTKPGFVWANGEWLKIPFFVETDASVLRINTRLVRRVTEPVEVGATPVPATPDSLGDLLDAAVDRLDELGGPSVDPPSDQTLQDLTQFVQSQPGASAVSYQTPALSITDDDGNVGYVILERPDPITKYQAVRDLQALTTRWKQDLLDGDVLLISGDVTVEVPASRALTFLRELVAVYDLPSTDQQERMTELTGSVDLAKALVNAGKPPKSILNRIPPPPTAEQSRPSHAVSVSLPTRLQQADLHTPDSNKAYFFESTNAEAPNWCSTDAAITAAKSEGYQIIDFRGSASTIAAAIASSGQAGIFYFCGQWHSLERATSMPDALARTAEYKQSLGLTGEDLYPVISLTGFNSDGKAIPEYYIGAGAGFYAKEWQSANSVVFLSECSGADLVQGFDAREFIANNGGCFSTEAQRKLDSDFFGRLAGTVDDGQARTIGAAFDATFGGTSWALQGDGGGETVLSPAVIDYAPQTDVAVSPTTSITGQVTFDTPIDQTMADNVLSAEGCGAVITAQRWVDPTTLEFNYTTAEPGTLTFTLNADLAAAADGPTVKLDGNNDFVWTVQCTS